MDWKQRILEAVTGKVAAPQFRNTDLKRGGSDSLKDRSKVAHNAGSFEDLKKRSQVDTAARIARVHSDKPGPRMQRRIRKHDPDGTKYGLS